MRVGPVVASAVVASAVVARPASRPAPAAAVTTRLII
jgi:hypothetical protein